MLLKNQQQELVASSFTGSKSLALAGYGYAVFKVRAVTAVYCYGGPLVAQDLGLRSARVDHRLDRQDHAFGQLRALAFLPSLESAALRAAWSDTMPNKLAHHAEPVGFHVLLDGRSYVSTVLPIFTCSMPLYSEASSLRAASSVPRSASRPPAP